MNRYGRGIRLLGKRTLFLLVPYILLIQLATVWPELHGFLHGNIGESYCCSTHQEQSASGDQQKQSADHKCAVTLFLSGVVSWFDSLDIDFKAPQPEAYPLPFVVQFVYCPVSLPPVRGPPLGAETFV